MSPIVPFEFNVTNDGFWGDTTATLDWCEGNYEVSREQGLLGIEKLAITRRSI